METVTQSKQLLQDMFVLIESNKIGKHLWLFIKYFNGGLSDEEVERSLNKWEYLWIDIYFDIINILVLDEYCVDFWCKLYFQYVLFIKLRWRSRTYNELALGVFISFLVSFLSVGFGFVRGKIFKPTRIQSSVSFLIGYSLKLLIMFLAMSMSGFVCIALIIGMAMGQIMFEHIKKLHVVIED